MSINMNYSQTYIPQNYQNPAFHGVYYSSRSFNYAVNNGLHEFFDSVKEGYSSSVNYAYCDNNLSEENYGVFYNSVNYIAPNYQWMNNNVGQNPCMQPNNMKNSDWKSASVTSSFSPASSLSSSPTQTWTSPSRQSVVTAQQVIPHGNGAVSSRRIKIIKPQLSFQDKIDNSSSPWMPKLVEKPNAIEPLLLNMAINKNGKSGIHPYKVELEKFEINELQLVPCSTTLYKNIDDTDVIFVQTHSDLISLVEKLMKCCEIAIDLEHHSYRSYQGITCLMQISTRNTDYLIDTLSLRSDLHVLNKIFTNPKVLKVFHGADNDIQWLQRDLSLYIVNMFDTHQAAIALNIPPGKRTFSNLLSNYCNVQADKQYQLADWRIRPLPKELVKYSRMDTHYLLYIKDVMSNQLLTLGKGQNNMLKSVYQKSTDICKTVYKKPICDDYSFKCFYRKSGKKFNKNQLCALELMYYWRDKIARQEDDSVGYVLPNNMMISIAEKLPNSIEGIYDCCTPIPPLVLKNIKELNSIIVNAKCEKTFDYENNNYGNNNNKNNNKDTTINITINNITINNNNTTVNNNNIYNNNTYNKYVYNINDNNNVINNNDNIYSGQQQQQVHEDELPVWTETEEVDPVVTYFPVVYTNMTY